MTFVVTLDTAITRAEKKMGVEYLSYAVIYANTGIYPATLSRFVKTKQISLKNLEKLCRFLECTPNHLLKL